MEVTRNVILDLLPMYSANEVSADTRVLVEKYLETDPELANVAKHSAEMNSWGDAPLPINIEDKMRAYMKTKWLLSLRTLILAVLISIIFLALLAAFFISS